MRYTQRELFTTTDALGTSIDPLGRLPSIPETRTISLLAEGSISGCLQS